MPIPCACHKHSLPRQQPLGRLACRWLPALLAAVLGGGVLLPYRYALTAQPPTPKLVLKATAFAPDGLIPKQFTCSGVDASPALSWSDPPPGTVSFALIMDDPDAPRGTFVHWVIYNLPASLRQLPQGVPDGETLASGGTQGENDFPKTGYGGPCPPPGKPHRYFFRLYALDTMLKLASPGHRKDLDEAMKGHVLAKGELMGRFGR